ncbi:cytochrome P450 [Leptospira hartskeerlii]|uniref:Cytochrome P450 n=1 Tax=Leptospira hartskeerlii TaxID=2023177 RepID=A0A2M9X8V4_9LEPT|nr:cytochrome P450 [Leptospira hartskeerlii]PJZ24084.1 cytochrome P450 [Leptospira hartskeerlii]PJZ35078.1 cytochrome P450 [Leptospira hartskeerlii]
MFSLHEPTSSRTKKNKPNLPPGVFGIRALPYVSKLAKDPIGFFQLMHSKFGNSARFGLRQITFHLITQPEDIKRVLQENNQNYHKGVFYKELGRILGKGLLNSEGEFWKKQRKLIQPSFHKQRISEFVEIMAQETQKTSESWKKVSSLDISKEMMRLTFAIVGRTLFRTEVESYAARIEHSLKIALELVTKRITRIFPFPFSWPTPENLKLKRALKDMHSVVDELIAERKKNPSNDLISMLLEVRDEETGETMSESQVRDEAITLLLAGHETTANALSWGFYLLSKHPEICEKVREEANRVLGDKTPTLEDVQKLTYTRKVLDEVLRLYPPAWVIERTAMGPDQVGGYDVETGTNISICIFNIHRNPDFWENPDKFDPDRFDEERSADRPKYAYLPFGGGPRICIGNIFALTEATLILAMLVKNYKFQTDPNHPVVMEPLVTLRPKYGILLNIVST